jgi:hypothetical protein
LIDSFHIFPGSLVAYFTILLYDLINGNMHGGALLSGLHIAPRGPFSGLGAPSSRLAGTHRALLGNPRGGSQALQDSLGSQSQTLLVEEEREERGVEHTGVIIR